MRKDYKTKDILTFRLMPEAVEMFKELSFMGTTKIIRNCFLVAEKVYKENPENFFKILQSFNNKY